jgi:2-keto-4-pentenoate hydratase
MTSNAAQQLWDARNTGAVLGSWFEGYPETEAEAYQIQSDMIALCGQEVTGWKVGATVEALFDVLGLSQPFLGPLFQESTVESGSELKALPGHGLEVEFTIRLKSALPARNTAYTRAEISEAIEAVYPSLEIVGSRFDRGDKAPGPRIISDGGANVATVMGPAINNWQELGLEDFAVTLTVNGENVCDGNTSILVWDHIVDALAWALQQPILSERGLKANDIVMTGSCTGITPVSPGDEAMADFGVMGEVRAHFV